MSASAALDGDDGNEGMNPAATDLASDSDCDGSDLPADPVAEDKDKKDAPAAGCGCDAGGQGGATAGIGTLLVTLTFRCARLGA